MDLTQDECLKLWHYKDGVLYWNDPCRNRKQNGIIGHDGPGYIRVYANKKSRRVHRIIYIMHFGDIPNNMEIDHINHIRDDNRIENLRAVSKSENHKNSSISKNNKSGFTGVYISTYKRKTKIYKYYYANIMSSNKIIRLGRFKTLDEAIAARKQANIKYGFHENHGLETVDNKVQVG